MPDTIIYKICIRVGDGLFKPVVKKRPPGQLGSTSGIAGGLVREFMAVLDLSEVPHFLDKLKSRGHKLMAMWGEKMLLREMES